MWSGQFAGLGVLTYMCACVCGLVSLQYAHLHVRVCVWSGQFAGLGVLTYMRACVCGLVSLQYAHLHVRVCVWSGQFAGLGMLTYMCACVCGLDSLQDAVNRYFSPVFVESECGQCQCRNAKLRHKAISLPRSVVLHSALDMSLLLIITHSLIITSV